jgi:hypothetical protein
MSQVNGIGGWLLVLCRLLTFWHPVIVGLSAVRTITSVSILDRPVQLILLARVLATAFGVAAGLALRGRRPGAVRMATAALLLAGGTHLLQYLTPHFPHNRAPGETFVWVLGAMMYYGAWLIYLQRSKRVRATFVERP